MKGYSREDWVNRRAGDRKYKISEKEERLVSVKKYGLCKKSIFRWKWVGCVVMIFWIK